MTKLKKSPADDLLNQPDKATVSSQNAVFKRYLPDQTSVQIEIAPGIFVVPDNHAGECWMEALQILADAISRQGKA